ncbi:hypothetical protein K458DRAFT_393945 [Lentithecium fluviatile CBS 122367]|uniref:Thiolase-like protein n=1 Tax=Lentithecium fluviatile CBS 122367 TaxID=1168545 RepID=A0A6G1IMQ0_9PLEO|nr:hypothetical protein K458DRAFT_393945 [Lentithecium fluviatile CBS 122367]
MIGGLKPSIGHSEGASGISSLLKVIIRLENRTIPATIGITEINPAIKHREWNVEINGVSTNRGSTKRSGTVLVVCSAKSRQSLVQSAKSLSKWISNPGQNTNVEDFLYTINICRSRFAFRSFVVGEWDSLATGFNTPDLEIEELNSPKPQALTFIFTGQGAQWNGMARELLRNFAVFADCISRLDMILQALPPDSAPSRTLDYLLSCAEGAEKTNDARISQTACTAVQIALVNLLRY